MYHDHLVCAGLVFEPPFGILFVWLVIIIWELVLRSHISCPVVHEKERDRERGRPGLYISRYWVLCVCACVCETRETWVNIYIYIYMTLCAFMWEEKELREQ